VFIPIEGAVRAFGRIAAFEVPAAELAVLATAARSAMST